MLNIASLWRMKVTFYVICLYIYIYIYSSSSKEKEEGLADREHGYET